MSGWEVRFMEEPKTKPDIDLHNLALGELRYRWAKAWDIQPHQKISKTMLLRSLEHKIREQDVGRLPPDKQKYLDKMVAVYKRNPRCFDENIHGFKPGTKITRLWKEKPHTVIVVPDGFEYSGKTYTSLSAVASEIAGTRWNGWVFFGLKNNKPDMEVTQPDVV